MTQLIQMSAADTVEFLRERVEDEVQGWMTDVRLEFILEEYLAEGIEGGVAYDPIALQGLLYDYRDSCR